VTRLRLCKAVLGMLLATPGLAAHAQGALADLVILPAPAAAWRPVVGHWGRRPS
jgi:hypothetical protein